jgi:hypothetical protein
VVGQDQRAKEEASASRRAIEEVGGERRNPVEDREASTRLEHEHGDRLLDEETDDDGGPRN